MGHGAVSAPDVVVVGDLMVDVGVEAGSLARGGDVHGDVRLRPGGAGANAAVWAAAHGARVRVHGRVGDDLPGRLIIDALEERGLEAAVGRDPDVRTGAVLTVHRAGERSMVADRGANARLSSEHLPEVLEAGAVLVSGYLFFEPASEGAASTALKRARAPHVAVDAASWPLIRSYGVDPFLAATSAANLMLANEEEARELTGAGAEEAARSLAASTGRGCVKLGEGGAVMADGETIHRARVRPVQGADPTGAGDAFAGVLLAALSRGMHIDAALQQAAEAAGRSVASETGWPE